jgi:hypothetical protein
MSHHACQGVEGRFARELSSRESTADRDFELVALPGIAQSLDLAGFVQEVSSAHTCDGVHCRNSAEVGRDVGRRRGALAALKS